jgi:hypothetical protein
MQGGMSKAGRTGGVSKQSEVHGSRADFVGLAGKAERQNWDEADTATTR